MEIWICRGESSSAANPPRTQLCLEHPAGPALQSVDRVLGPTHLHRDLGRSHSHDVAQQDDAPLIVSECVEGHPQVATALSRVIAVDLGDGPDVLAGYRAPNADVVDGRVVGDTQDPAGERHLSRLVVAQRLGKAREDVLGDVLRVVLVADDRADIAVDVVAVAQIQEPQRILVADARTPDGVEQQPVGAPVQRFDSTPESLLSADFEAVCFHADIVW